MAHQIIIIEISSADFRYRYEWYTKLEESSEHHVYTISFACVFLIFLLLSYSLYVRHAEYNYGHNNVCLFIHNVPFFGWCSASFFSPDVVHHQFAHKLLLYLFILGRNNLQRCNVEISYKNGCQKWWPIIIAAGLLPETTEIISRSKFNRLASSVFSSLWSFSSIDLGENVWRGSGCSSCGQRIGYV